MGEAQLLKELLIVLWEKHYQYMIFYFYIHVFKNMKVIWVLIFILALPQVAIQSCLSCYQKQRNQNCLKDQNELEFHLLHMSVHPHLDAFWIFDFDAYYSAENQKPQVKNYFQNNRFHSVKEIFDSALTVLSQSKSYRESGGSGQKAYRSFFNSEMGFFKKWYTQLEQNEKLKVKELMKTKYWEIVGGGLVQHDEGCAYYEDIIGNYEIGLKFLKEQLNVFPKIAISADSFGHSQSTLAILAHLGIQGFIVERSDEHILLQNKTQFIWKAKSSNNKFYGALPTHIRWAIHGFEDQFIKQGGSQRQLCEQIQPYISNMRKQNQFLKNITKSRHILRYFGHDFQKFDDYSYSVIESIMETFSKQKCSKVAALYGNPTQYFASLMSETFKKVKPFAFRTEDIMPIWDYDSGLYWTGYYTTDPYHKKMYRDTSRFLNLARKAFFPMSLKRKGTVETKKIKNILEELAEVVGYLQHHDGISGTSKYSVLDQYEIKAEKLREELEKSLIEKVFSEEYSLYTSNPILYCGIDKECTLPNNVEGNIYLKILNSGRGKNSPIVIGLPENTFYKPDCDHQINCMCYKLPCSCQLYLYTALTTFHSIKLTKITEKQAKMNFLTALKSSHSLNFNSTHFKIKLKGKQYYVGYKSVKAQSTPRSYDHLSRYGTTRPRTFNINSGKYALGNNPNDKSDYSLINKVLELETDKMIKIVIKWKRQQMKTVVTILKNKFTQIKVQTLSAAESPKTHDLYLQIATSIQNNKTFYTDSNGWLVMERVRNHHEDYQAYFSPEGFDDINGNTYPATSFAYIKDQTNKVSVNLDRPQGVISPSEGILWINFDRLTSDDGKWVYESAYRNQYQKFTHIISVQNEDYNERKLQKAYDEPIVIQANQIPENQRILQLKETKQEKDMKEKWLKNSGIENIKFWWRPWTNQTLLMRIHNIHDEKNQSIGLFSNRTSVILSSYYNKVVNFQEIKELSLGGNMLYDQFLRKKWNWNQIVNLTQENSIFNKEFSQVITLKPLQIRTFLFKGLSFSQATLSTQQPLFLMKEKQNYELSLTKPYPQRMQLQKEQNIIQYLLKGDHCLEQSPIKSKEKQTQSQKPIVNKLQKVNEEKTLPKSNEFYKKLIELQKKAKQSENDKEKDVQKIEEPNKLQRSEEVAMKKQNKNNEKQQIVVQKKEAEKIDLTKEQQQEKDIKKEQNNNKENHVKPEVKKQNKVEKQKEQKKEQRENKKQKQQKEQNVKKAEIANPTMKKETKKSQTVVQKLNEQDKKKIQEQYKIQLQKALDLLNNQNKPKVIQNQQGQKEVKEKQKEKEKEEQVLQSSNKEPQKPQKQVTERKGQLVKVQEQIQEQIPQKNQLKKESEGSQSESVKEKDKEQQRQQKQQKSQKKEIQEEVKQQDAQQQHCDQQIKQQVHSEKQEVIRQQQKTKEKQEANENILQLPDIQDIVLLSPQQVIKILKTKIQERTILQKEQKENYFRNKLQKLKNS